MIYSYDIPGMQLFVPPLTYRPNATFLHYPITSFHKIGTVRGVRLLIPGTWRDLERTLLLRGDIVRGCRLRTSTPLGSSGRQVCFHVSYYTSLLPTIILPYSPPRNVEAAIIRFIAICVLRHEIFMGLIHARICLFMLWWPFIKGS